MYAKNKTIHNTLAPMDFIKIRIEGIVIDPNFDDEILIRPCICVTFEDCTCDNLDDIVIWLRGQPKSTKVPKQCNEQDIYSFKTQKDEQTLVQSFLPMNVSTLFEMKQKI
jgi:hypothetical protein